jgi:uncharacterized protein DUF4255
VASFTAISATGKTLERLLNACFAVDKPHPTKTVKAALVRTDDFDKNNGTSVIKTKAPLLSIFLYRVEVDAVTRAGWSAVGSIDGRAHLPLDLHYLLTAWAEGPEFEHQILGSTMTCLETTPILSGPLLHPSSAWEANEAVQVGPEDLPTENLMRIYDSLEASYRASLPYRARVIRLDGTVATPPSTVTDFVLGYLPDDP